MSVPEQPPRRGLDDIPADKDVDILVPDVMQSDGARELIDEAHGVDDEGAQRETLGTRRGFERLGRYHGLQRRVGETEDDIEEKVRRQRTLRVRRDDVVALCLESRREARVDGQTGRTSCEARLSVVLRQLVSAAKSGRAYPEYRTPERAVSACDLSSSRQSGLQWRK